MNDAMQGALSAEDRAEFRVLTERASAGPWRACGCERGGCECRQVWSIGADALVAVALRAEDEAYTSGEGFTVEQAKANAEFIAAARTALPRLLDALEQSERELAYLRKHGCYGAPSIDGGVAMIGRPTPEEVSKAVAVLTRRTPPEPASVGTGERAQSGEDDG